MKSSKSAKHNGQSDVFTSFPNFFLSYKSLPSCRWHADLEIILSQIDLEIILSQIGQVQNIYCEKSAGEMAIFCKCRKYTKLQEWKTQETFQREKFHVSESIPVQQSLSPEMQIFFFSFVWYVCFFGWILAFLGNYVCFESCLKAPTWCISSKNSFRRIKSSVSAWPGFLKKIEIDKIELWKCRCLKMTPDVSRRFKPFVVFWRLKMTPNVGRWL